jgi:ribosomal protein L11 methyltransferase
MAWLSLSIQTDCQHAEALADALLDAGALAASIEDADAGTPDEQPQFGEPDSISRPGWNRSRVIALLKPDSDARQLLASCAALAGLDDLPAFTQEEVADQDWVRLTQSQFEPIRVSEALVDRSLMAPGPRSRSNCPGARSRHGVRNGLASDDSALSGMA